MAEAIVEGFKDRAQLLDIDGRPDVDVVQPRVSPALDENYLTRQEAARLAAEKIGIEWPKTILPEGTALYESGVEKLKGDRAAWAMLPFAQDALPVVRGALAAEDRQDVRIPVAHLYANPEDGRIEYPASVGSLVSLGYDPHAFKQLVGQTDALKDIRHAGSVLLQLPAAERAWVLNQHLQASKATVTARTKMAHNGHRIARAFLSERYADVNDIHVAEALEAALGDDGRTARLDYKPGDKFSRFEVFYPSEIPIETFKVGDIHRVVMLVDNSETGEGAVNIIAGLIRAICANLTTAAGVVKIRHIGDAEHRRLQMRAAIRDALGLLDPLVQAITVSARTAIPEGETGLSIIEKLANKYRVTEERAKAWANTYESSYAHSPTVWGVSSAISEAAQTQEWWHAQAEEEAIAKQLVHVHWKALN